LAHAEDFGRKPHALELFLGGPLGQIGVSDSEEFLRQLEKDSKDEDVRRAAGRALFKLKQGAEGVVNDARRLAEREGEPPAPAIPWLRERGFLANPEEHENKPLSREDWEELIPLLIEGRGVGLMAVRGSVVPILRPEDEATLLQIRRAGFVSPTDSSVMGRRNAISKLIRHLRRSR